VDKSIAVIAKTQEEAKTALGRFGLAVEVLMTVIDIDRLTGNETDLTGWLDMMAEKDPVACIESILVVTMLLRHGCLIHSQLFTTPLRGRTREEVTAYLYAIQLFGCIGEQEADPPVRPSIPNPSMN